MALETKSIEREGKKNEKRLGEKGRENASAHFIQNVVSVYRADSGILSHWPILTLSVNTQAPLTQTRKQYDGVPSSHEQPQIQDETTRQTIKRLVLAAIGFFRGTVRSIPLIFSLLVYVSSLIVSEV